MHPVTASLALLLSASASAAEPTVLVDAGEGAQVPVDVRGDFWTESGVKLREAAPGHMDVALFRAPAFRDGVVEAELYLRRRPWATLLVRAHTDTSPDGSLEGLSAVGLTVRGGWVRWDRWDDGVTLPISGRCRLKTALHRVRVRIEADDQELRATVLRVDTDEVLGTCIAADAGSTVGRVGFRVQEDTESAIRELVVTPADAQSDPPEDTATAPMGDRRFLLLPPDDMARLQTLQETADPGDPIPAIEDLGVWPYDDRGWHGALVSLPELAMLDALGLRVEERPLVPYWAVDPDVRAASRAVPDKDGRPDLRASFKDPEMVEAVLRRWHALHPTITRLERLGTSHQGRPIWALVISDEGGERSASEPAVLLTGATHGSELLSTEYALDAADRLLRGYGTDPEATARVDGLATWVVPLVNPDGNHHVHTVTRFGGRKNGRTTWKQGGTSAWGGVDLNRNFPLGFGRDEQASRSFPNSAYYRGEAPLSEPESQAIAALARRERFAAAISFHTNASMILVPYSLNGFAQPQPNAAWTVAEEIAAVTPQQPNGKDLRVRRMIYPVDGSDQDWLRHAFGTVSYIVEGSHHNPEERPIRLASIEALTPVVPTLLDRVLDGPRLTVFATVDGEPVEATITVSAESLGAGEVWTTDPVRGRHDRVLASGGPMTVTASAAGHGSVSQEVVVDGATTVRLALPGE